MIEVLPAIGRWLESGERVALATVVRAYGSAPRGEGAKMAVASGGAMAGSVSGGCVEADVALHCREVLAEDEPRLVRYGISDEMAFDVGLACGGEIEVFIEPIRSLEIYDALERCIAGETGTALLTLLTGGEAGAKLLVSEAGVTHGAPGAAALLGTLASEALRLLRDGRSGVISYPEVSGGEALVFVEAYAPPPTLLLFGGVHVAVELARLAKPFGFRVVVVDARSRFATRERFPDADEVAISWADDYLAGAEPRGNTYVAVLTHDPKLDDPAIIGALGADVRYIGAIGSTRTHAVRLDRLRAAGVTEDRLARIHAPIGLDLDARNPAEIALSVLAEVVAVKNNRPAAAPSEPLQRVRV